MINLKTNKIYTKEDILKNASQGKFMNTDGIRSDLNGKGMAKFLASIGFNIMSYEDVKTNGIVKTKEGIQVSTNGYCSLISKSILWKYDKELGIAYFCPKCKLFLCSHEKNCKCGQEIDWNNEVEYKGKVKWN